MKTYKKIIIGYVIQEFERQNDGRFKCIEQSFGANDQVDYENDNGDTVEIDESKEIYFPMEMVQPE
jgi:hypothetical protein